MQKYLKRSLAIAGVALLLVFVGLVVIWPDRPPRTEQKTEIFQSVVYERQARSTPRPMMIHIVEIDLSAPGIGFLVTPGDKGSGLDLYASTTGSFLKEFGLQVAVNGGFFEPFRPGFIVGYEPNSGDAVNVKGLAISNGETYSQDQEYADYPALCLGSGQAQIREGGCPAGTMQALAGTPLLVEGGVMAEISDGAYHTGPHPRTAVAVDAKGETLWLIVVDGRQPDYSEGATLAELVDIILELGADAALNLDGGGSTTLVMAGANGAVLLNSPIHTRIPMRQRPVGNHLGVYALSPVRSTGP